MAQDFLKLLRAKAKRKILFLPHAIRQMSRPERMISTSEIRKVISEGEIVEDYPKDSRGHSCLVLGNGDENRPIHVVCAPKDEYLAVITAYIPSENQWQEDKKSRRKR